MRLVYFLVSIVITSAASGCLLAGAQPSGSRPGYIYDNADIISPEYETRIDQYLRQLDEATTAEIVIYTLTDFVGHGIAKDGIEIQDRDMLAYYIFNQVPLDGITGIGKKGKDNGVLVMLSLERDAGGGSMRIEVGRGLEGNITDGTAGEILDAFLVPARNEYESSGDMSLFDQAFLDTVVSLGALTGYQSQDYAPPAISTPDGDIDQFLDSTVPWIFFAFIAVMIILSFIGRKRGRRWAGSSYGGWGGGSSGGGFGGGGGGGGGGGSGGGGAGR